MNSAASGSPPPRRRRSGSNATPATASITTSARVIAGLPQVVELNIGHFLIGEAIFVGLAESVKCMRAAMEEGRAIAEGRR